MNKQQILKLLRDEEETILVDLLNLTSTEIVDAFLDRIEERYEYIYSQYESDLSEDV
jgi:hypothetical protein